MKLIIDISKERYDEIMSMDWKNCRLIFGEEIRAIHDGKTLEQKPCEDAVSRQAVLDVLDKSKYSNEFCEEHHIDWSINLGMAHIVVNELKPVTLQPCGDAISRQAVLEVIRKCHCEEWVKADIGAPIEALQSVTQQPNVGSSPEKPNKWIPVSERLPEVGSQVLVCYEFKKHRSVYIANFYGDGKFHGLDDEYLTTEGRKYRKAIAWMPLPTPPKMSEIPTGAEGSDKE